MPVRSASQLFRFPFRLAFPLPRLDQPVDPPVYGIGSSAPRMPRYRSEATHSLYLLLTQTPISKSEYLKNIRLYEKMNKKMNGALFIPPKGVYLETYRAGAKAFALPPVRIPEEKYKYWEMINDTQIRNTAFRNRSGLFFTALSFWRWGKQCPRISSSGRRTAGSR